MNEQKIIQENLQRGDVTLIAKVAGVSTPTASRVLNGHAVNHNLTQKVLNAALGLVQQRNAEMQEIRNSFTNLSLTILPT